MKRRGGFALWLVPVLALVTLQGCGADPNGGDTTNTNAIATPRSKIDEIKDKMPWGQISFNIPPSMQLDVTQTVALLLSPELTADELKGELHERGVIGDIKSERIKVSDKMQVVLLGDGFQITPLTEDTLDVSKRGSTQWSWDVRPLRAGRLNLHFVVNAIVDLDDGAGPRPHPIRVFDKPYDVEVATTTFFGIAWPWLLAALLLPAAGAAWLWRRGSKAPGGRARPAPAAGRDARVFLSYRREDTAGHAGRLRDALADHFGAGRVFMDIDSIGYGEDFVEAVEKAVGSCAVVIVLIGRQWLSASDKKGARRLDDPGDFVRLEVETALKRGVKVIPVLVQAAEMPGADALPAPLAQLARRNAVEISDTRWSFDVERLAAAVEEALSNEPAKHVEPGASPA